MTYIRAFNPTDKKSIRHTKSSHRKLDIRRRHGHGTPSKPPSTLRRPCPQEQRGSAQRSAASVERVTAADAHDHNGQRQLHLIARIVATIVIDPRCFKCLVLCVNLCARASPLFAEAVFFIYSGEFVDGEIEGLNFFFLNKIFKL